MNMLCNEGAGFVGKFVNEGDLGLLEVDIAMREIGPKWGSVGNYDSIHPVHWYEPIC